MTADPSPPTPFIEANALLAMQEEEWDAAAHWVNKLLPGERLTLARACERLANSLRAYT